MTANDWFIQAMFLLMFLCTGVVVVGLYQIYKIRKQLDALSKTEEYMQWVSGNGQDPFKQRRSRPATDVPMEET